MDVNKPYYDDHFAKYANINSLYCTPETAILYVKYISIKKEDQHSIVNSTSVSLLLLLCFLFP